MPSKILKEKGLVRKRQRHFSHNGITKCQQAVSTSLLIGSLKTCYPKKLPRFLACSFPKLKLKNTGHIFHCFPLLHSHGNKPIVLSIWL